MPVVLETGSKFNLCKVTKALGKININLNWNSNPNQNSKSKNFFKSLISANNCTDLDLGCFYELKNGRRGAIQALGNSFGDYYKPPYVMLENKGRINNTNGKSLLINKGRIKEIQRILIYTFIYNGTVSWKQMEGRVTIQIDGKEDTLINIDKYDDKYPMCALMMLEIIDDKSFEVEKIVDFFKGHREMDKEYNWNLKWVARKI